MKRLNVLTEKLLTETHELIQDELELTNLQKYLSGLSQKPHKTIIENLSPAKQQEFSAIQSHNITKNSEGLHSLLNKSQANTIPKEFIVDNKSQLNLQSTLMNIQKEYLEYESQKAQSEENPLDLDSIEEEFLNGLLKGDSQCQILLKKKKKSQFINLLKMCNICSDSDLNYASKPFKLMKKLKDVRIMFERKSNNVEQQLRKSNMNKNRIIEDIKADKVVIRKTLPEMAKIYLSEIQASGALKENASKREQMKEYLSTPPSKFQSNVRIMTPNNNNNNNNSNSSNNNFNNSSYNNNNQKKQEQYQSKDYFFSDKFQVKKLSQNNLIQSKQNSTSNQNNNSTTNLHSSRNLHAQLNHPNFYFTPSKNPFNSARVKDHSSSKTNQTKSTDHNSSYSGVQKPNTMAKSNQTRSTDKIYFPKYQPEKTFIKKQPGLQNSNIPKHLNNSNSSYLYLNTSPAEMTTPIKNEILSFQTSKNKQQFALSERQTLANLLPPSESKRQNNPPQTEGGLKQELSLEKMQYYLFCSNLPSAKQDSSSYLNNQQIANPVQIQAFSSLNNRRKSTLNCLLQQTKLQQSQQQQEQQHQKQQRIENKTKKQKVPSSGILAQVYNFEEDDYFKQQQIYKFDQEKAKMLMIKRNKCTHENLSTKRSLRMNKEQKEDLLHDQYSSNDDSIPSATEAQLDNCYEESIKLQRKIQKTGKGDLQNKIKSLLRIETVSKQKYQNYYY